MEEALTQLGVGGIFVLMVLERVFAFVSKRRNGQNGKEPGHLLAEVHRVVTQEDTDGGKKIYSRPKLEEAITALTAMVREQSGLLRAMQRDHVETRRSITALAEQLATSKP